jgi:betaine-aldehyde dehydrogenase
VSEPRVLRNFVDGQYRDPASDARSEVVDPSTGQVVASAPVSGPADVDAAYDAATRAFEGWRDATPADRQRALLRIADAVEARAEEFVRLEGQNTGKPNALTASEEVPPMVDQILFFAGAARVLEGAPRRGVHGRAHLLGIRREPIGSDRPGDTVNYPMMMAVWKVAPAIAAATPCAQASDTTPETTLLLPRSPPSTCPAGVLNVVTGDPSPDTGRLVVEHAAPQMVRNHRFRAGRHCKVAQSASVRSQARAPRARRQGPRDRLRRRRRGGRRRGIAVAGYFNAGQDCTAATRCSPRPASRRLRRPRSPEQAKQPGSGCRTTTTALLGPVNNAGPAGAGHGFLARLPVHAAVGGGRRPPHGLGTGSSCSPRRVGPAQDDEAIQTRSSAR